MAPTPGPVQGAVGPVDVQDPPTYLMSPRKSMTVSTKGLLNMPGQNNCFLNSAVQVLWHLDIFRRSFRELATHACMAESCIFCALKELFTQFQYSQESALPPDALRHALAKTFCDQRRFQLGFMDDAAECFENILLRIHVHIANQESDDMCSNLHCIPHQKFAMTLVEQRVCHNCGSTSEPLPFTQIVHYVTTSALCTKSLESKAQDPNFRTSFGTHLRLAGDMGEVRDCPSGCGSKIHVKKTLMNHPEIVSVGLVWDSECPTLQHITDVFYSIGMYLHLPDMFNAVYDMEWASCTMHQLVGVVTYYGKHYSTFFFHTKLRVWIYFDDATVREVGPSWEQVVEKCQRGRFQPLLLLFANPNGSSALPQPPMQECNTSDQMSKSARAISQRQAVIRQYLTLQNSYPNPNYKSRYSNAAVNLPPSYDMHSPYANTMPPHVEQTGKFHSYNIPSHSFYEQHRMGSQPPPVYSNLQQLGPHQLPIQPYQQERASMSKFNEVSLQETHSSKSEPTDMQPLYNATKSYDMPSLDKKKDFDAAKDSDSAFTEDDPEGSDMYISRKTVENVLSLQKRKMSLCRSYSQSSVGNRNSSSSLESFDVQLAKANSIKSQQAESLCRRDSGTWSSDRNSSSSNNSVENPFLTVVTSKRLLLGLNGLHNSAPKGPPSDYSNTNASDYGYDSFSVSSSDSYPSINNSPVKLDPRMTQIPEDWLPEENGDLDKKLKLVTEDTSGPPDCDKLCAEADLLLAKSHEKEKDGDLVMAALLCDSAAARARQAMEAPYNNSRSLVSAKMKHSTCVMRSSCLYRRLKDHEVDERRKQKAHTGHHSRQGSRDSTHSRHSRQSSKDSTHSKSGSKENNNQSDESDNFGKNIEIYGTLPKKSRKKTTGVAGVTKAKDDQVYQDFLDKQRKNTSLSNALSETAQKNVDVPQNRSENATKSKLPVTNERHHRKSSADSMPPKSPTRRKSESPVKSDPETRKKTQRPVEQSYLGLFPSSDCKETDMCNRDLLSPLSSPDKKQHKIKRKLMGGFMKRKNRSLPDLREDQDLSDPLDRSFDDAIISAPSTLTLPNGKLKRLENKPDPSMANVSRGFHQPHHAFVKKDLTQRPLLMKVNPPNVQQSPSLPSPKSKLVHTLPSLPKKSSDSISKTEVAANVNGKPPSKIPFITSLSKPDNPSMLPPLQTLKQPEVKILPKPPLHKASAIPVLAPQVPLSALKANFPKEELTSTTMQTHVEKEESEDLPHPSNPFLMELQAKRKQVLNRAQQKKDSGDEIDGQVQQSVPRDTSSLLPKLVAPQSEGTSWLQELQSKQKQILNKQDDGTNTHPPKVVNLVERKEITQQSSYFRNKEPERGVGPKTVTIVPKSTKVGFEVNGISQNEPERIGLQNKATNHKTSSSVKDLASRFEKVLIKPNDTSDPPAVEREPENAPDKQASFSFNLKRCFDSNEVTQTVEEKPEIKSQSVISRLQESVSNSSSEPPTTFNGYPLKSALKSKPENNDATLLQKPSENSDSLPVGGAKPCEMPVKNRSFCEGTPESNPSIRPIKPALKQPSADGAVMAQRPMQPPDYATAMQRLELIRTSNGDGQMKQLELDPAKTESSKKKQGPKKTVTFSDEVVLVACAEYDEIDFSSNPLFERVYQQHMKAGRGEIPNLPSIQEPPPPAHIYANSLSSETGFGDALKQPSSNVPSPCNLCHNKIAIPPSTYCTDCEFYLSRFKA